MPEIERTDEEWRSLLTPEQYQVLRQAGTERPWSGKYADGPADEHADGTYHCAACGTAVCVRSSTTCDPPATFA